jgi:hypothetical protein
MAPSITGAPNQQGQQGLSSANPMASSANSSKDILVVPEEALGGSTAWNTTLETAQRFANLALAAAVAVDY